MFLLTCEDFFAHLRLSPDSNSNPAGEFKLIRQLATSLLPQMFTLNCFFSAHRSNNHEFTCLNQPLSRAFYYHSITRIQREKLTFLGHQLLRFVSELLWIGHYININISGCYCLSGIGARFSFTLFSSDKYTTHSTSAISRSFFSQMAPLPDSR